MAENRTKVREVKDPVVKQPEQINWANIIDPRSIPIDDTGSSLMKLGGSVISAGVKYGKGAKASALKEAQSEESANMIGNLSKLMVDVDSSIASGAEPQSVLNAAYVQAGQILATAKHLSPGDQLDMLNSSRNMINDAVGMKMTVNSGIATISDGYGNIRTVVDKANENKGVMADIIKAVVKEKPEIGIRMQEIRLAISNTDDPNKREQLSQEMTGLINQAKRDIAFDHELATKKLQRELSKEDASVTTARRNKDYAFLQNTITDNYLNFAGPTFTEKFLKRVQNGEDPAVVKSLFNNAIKNVINSKSVRGELADLGKSSDDLMSDLRTTIAIGESLIDNLSTKQHTSYETEKMTSEARLKVLNLIGQDGLAKISAVKEMSSIMNINYVMARKVGDTFSETQFASNIIGSLVGGKEVLSELQSKGDISGENLSALLTSMKGYISGGVNSVQGMDLYNTMAFSAALTDHVLLSDKYTDVQKKNFISLKDRLLANLPPEERAKFDTYVTSIKSLIKEEE